MSSPASIPKAIEEICRQDPKGIAFEMGERAYSCEESLFLSRSVSSFLSLIGVGPKERVAIFMENRLEWGILYFGISFLGATAVPVDVQLKPDELINVMLDSGSKAIFVSGMSAKGLSGLAELAGSRTQIIPAPGVTSPREKK